LDSRAFSPVSRDLPSFPTRRSSDLDELADSLVEIIDRRIDQSDHQDLLIVLQADIADQLSCQERKREGFAAARHSGNAHLAAPVDRKSTRLNSSHGKSSYAVFCLKK